MDRSVICPFLKLLAIMLTALGAGAVSVAAEDKPKNVLLLYVDDLRPEIGAYGKSKIVSPHLDRLANRSLVFNKAYCQVPVCMASRVSTLSGMYARYQQQNHLRKLLPAGKPSLPGHFKANGYDTISIGKVYHMNADDPESWTKRYTDTFYERELVCDGWCSGFQTEKNLEGRTFRGTGRNKAALTEFVDAPDSAYPDGMSAEKAVADIKKYSQSGKPLFLAVGFYRPHLPWVAPKKYWDMYKPGDIDLAENQFLPEGAVSRNDWGDLTHYTDKVVINSASKRTDLNAENFPVLPKDKQRELIHAYWACVSFIDAQIGRILDALDETGMKDNTMIVLVSDHGWQLGEHRLWSKCSNYEEAIRVPLIVTAPGITSGQKTEALTELIDIYPSMCEFAGLPIPDHVEGVSLMPLLKDPSLKLRKAAFNIWAGARSMRTERYRLTVYDKAIQDGDKYQFAGDQRYEIYDYQTDPKGNVNIAANPENAPLLERLTKMMDDEWNVTGLNVVPPKARRKGGRSRQSNKSKSTGKK